MLPRILDIENLVPAKLPLRSRSDELPQLVLLSNQLRFAALASKYPIAGARKSFQFATSKCGSPKAGEMARYTLII
jgi:hypothetical protein